MWGHVCTNRGSSERSVVAVLLPGAVEAQHKVLEEGMSFVEHWKTEDVDPLVGYVVESEQREFLQGKSEKERQKWITGAAEVDRSCHILQWSAIIYLN